MIAGIVIAFVAGIAATVALAHFATSSDGTVSLSWGPWYGFGRIRGSAGEIRQWTAGWLSVTYLPFHVDALIDAAAPCEGAGAERLSLEVGEAMGGARRN